MKYVREIVSTLITTLLVCCLAYVVLSLTACRGNDGESIVGPQGPAGVNGSNGSNGTNGTNGVDGTNGTNGVDAIPVTWVQFCPGVTTYPNNFQEGGFCINHKMYGVYSANNGFLTFLPLGVYNSNAIGNSCSFTLLADCQIQ